MELFSIACYSWNILTEKWFGKEKIKALYPKGEKMEYINNILKHKRRFKKKSRACLL